MIPYRIEWIIQPRFLNHSNLIAAFRIPKINNNIIEFIKNRQGLTNGYYYYYLKWDNGTIIFSPGAINLNNSKKLTEKAIRSTLKDYVKQFKNEKNKRRSFNRSKQNAEAI